MRDLPRSGPGWADLRNADHAWKAARNIVRNLTSTQSDTAVNWLRCSFEVWDEADEIVLEFLLSELSRAKSTRINTSDHTFARGNNHRNLRPRAQARTRYLSKLGVSP